MRKLILTLIVFFSLSTSSHAIPVNGIIKFFKEIISEIDTIFNVGKKAVKESDQSIDLGKNAVKQGDEANQVVVSDELIRLSSDNTNLASINKFSSNIDLQTLHKSSSNENAKFHQLDKVSDAFEFDDFTKEDEFSNYVLLRWVGYVLRTSNYYRREISNNQNNEKRIILQCTNQNSVFTFTIDEINRGTKIAYLSYHVNKNNEPLINKQKLHVLGDTKDYLLLSVKKEVNKKFPTHYFIIHSDQRFENHFYPQGTESPALIKTRINKKAKNFNNKCYRNFLNEGTIAMKTKN